MRAVIQRVNRAKVEIDGEIASSINVGLLIFLGVEDEDNEQDVEWLSGKVGKMRIFSDEDGRMNLNVDQVNGEILVVSQFTLHASTKKGNRPSFVKAGRPEHAEKLYASFVSSLKGQVKGNVETGVFGAMMAVELVNDGPVTILIDTKNKE